MAVVSPMQGLGLFKRTTQTTSPALPFGYISGLVVTYASVATVTLGVGECRNSTNTADIVLTGASTASLAAAGAEGLDTGSEATGTWYYVYAIGDSTGANTAKAMFSLHVSSPTMPSGYDVFRRIQAIHNDGSGNIIAFVARGKGTNRYTFWNTDHQSAHRKVLSGGLATSFTDVDCSAAIPPTTTDISLYVTHGIGSGRVDLRTNGSAFADGLFGSSMDGHSSSPLTSANAFSNSTMRIQTDAAGVIEYMQNNTSSHNSGVFIRVNGYYEEI